MRKRSEAGAGGASLADALVAGSRVAPERNPGSAPIAAGGIRLSDVAERALSPGAPAAAPARPPLFATANRGPGISPDYERIVEAVYAVDAGATYEELERHLEIGEERGDYGTLRAHLDKAESRARRAHQLYLGAKLELARWEAESERVAGAMRAKALVALEAEKASGERKKQITDADVRARMVEEFPDEYEHQETKRVKLRGTVEHLERLADLWRGRCHSVSTLLTTLRK